MKRPAMSAATELLSAYAQSHRDRRNITSHFVGVPMIVFALGVFFARPEFSVGGLLVTPAWLLYAPVALWYLTRGDVMLGLAASAGVGVLMVFAHQARHASSGIWLAWGVGMFVVGWMIQLLGHLYEGKSPAFVTDLISLLVGPMFVVAEALFLFGWNKPLLAEIERRAGPRVLRDLARIA
jgi:uncharacterized membrane protein YGL010W